MGRVKSEAARGVHQIRRRKTILFYDTSQQSARESYWSLSSAKVVAPTRSKICKDTHVRRAIRRITLGRLARNAPYNAITNKDSCTFNATGSTVRIASNHTVPAVFNSRNRQRQRRDRGNSTCLPANVHQNSCTLCRERPCEYYDGRISCFNFK